MICSRLNKWILWIVISITIIPLQAADIIFRPQSLDFGFTGIRQTAVKTLVILNHTGKEIWLEAVENTQPAVFRTAVSLPLLIGVHDSLELQIIFEPLEEQYFEGWFRFTFLDGDVRTYLSVSVAGAGIVTWYSSWSVPFTITGGRDISHYRLLSFPGEEKHLYPMLESILGKQTSDRWRAFVWKNGFTEMNASSSYTSSKAFFLIQNIGDLRFTVQNLVTIRDSVVNVLLSPGWNLVRNPYPFPVTLSCISFENLNHVFLYEFSGSWQQSVRLEPGKGYAIFAQNAGVMRIHGYRQFKEGWGKPSVESWNQIIVRSEAGEDRCLYFRLSEMGTRHPKPDMLPLPVKGYFTSGSSDTDGFSHVELTPEEGIPLVIESSTGQEVELVFNRIKDEEAVQWILQDQYGHTWEVCEGVSVLYRQSQEREYFSLKASRKRSQSENPSGLTIYPNPGNPDFVITFPVHEKTSHWLRIFNMLGQCVYEIRLDGAMDGRYAFRWDGNDQDGRILPSGIYLVEITGKTRYYRGKLLLLR